MNPLARYEPSTNSNAGCADLMTMAERELSAFSKGLAARADCDRCLADFRPRVATSHCEGFDSAGWSIERFVHVVFIT
jgi:hypothetical protein